MRRSRAEQILPHSPIRDSGVGRISCLRQSFLLGRSNEAILARWFIPHKINRTSPRETRRGRFLRFSFFTTSPPRKLRYRARVLSYLSNSEAVVT